MRISSAMSPVDSEASFKARCLEVCRSSELYDLLFDVGIKTHFSLAFACGTPRAQPTDAEFTSFANTVVGRPCKHRPGQFLEALAL